MALRETLATTMLNTARSMGRILGTELVIECSEHSIETSMETPEQDDRAWDSNLYKHGQMFYSGYSNPIKPTVDVNKSLEEPDTVDIEEGTEGDENDAEGPHTELISSARYRAYMRQDLISQLLTPKEQWQMLAYGLLVLGVFQLLTVATVLWATGSF